MKMDARADSRPVRLAMNSGGQEMYRVYSGIVYRKGAAILNMVEQWIGPEAFRGLHEYLSEHALGNASTADLETALRKESGVDVAPVLDSFLNQTGFPTIRTASGCGFESGDAARWTIPLCVHGDDGASHCEVLSRTHEGSSSEACPAWTWPNRGGSGYFRVQFPAPLLETVVTKGWDQLTSPERLSLVEDTAYLVTSHKLEMETVLKVLPVMARDSQAGCGECRLPVVADEMLANAAPEDRAKYEAVVTGLTSGNRGRR